MEGDCSYSCEKNDRNNPKSWDEYSGQETQLETKQANLITRNASEVEENWAALPDAPGNLTKGFAKGLAFKLNDVYESAGEGRPIAFGDQRTTSKAEFIDVLAGIVAADLAGAVGSRGAVKVGVSEKPSTLKPGPFAVESIPGHLGPPTPAEQIRLNEIMQKHGCHTCGRIDPGTKSGNAVGDHQPPAALDTPREFYPHCVDCMRRQGGDVLQELLRRSR